MQEDQLLVKLVEAQPKPAAGVEIDWHALALFIPSRTAKQCRERWNGSLSPDLNKNPVGIVVLASGSIDSKQPATPSRIVVDDAASRRWISAAAAWPL